MAYLLRSALLTLLLAAAAACTAQTKRDTVFQPYWEIGVDLLPLIDKNKVPASTIFARRNYRYKDGAGRAWRLRVGMDTEIREWQGSTRFIPDRRQAFNPYLLLGHEWQRTSGRFRCFGAIDGYGSYHYRFHQILALPADSIVDDQTDRAFNLGLVGSVGFQANLTERIAVSIESSLSLNYWHWRSSAFARTFGKTEGGEAPMEKIFSPLIFTRCTPYRSPTI